MFRFEKLDVWNRTLEITEPIFDRADKLDELHTYRFAEQLRSAALSISNNIAEGQEADRNKSLNNQLEELSRKIMAFSKSL